MKEIDIDINTGKIVSRVVSTLAAKHILTFCYFTCKKAKIQSG